MIREAIAKLLENKNLSREEASAVMNEIMSGECTDAQIGGYLIALRVKGETVDEIAGSAEAMREKAVKISAPADVIDTCGTGGDCQGTFNVSTAAAIVACAAGAKVAKHGNRSVSSKSGSADVLKALGVNIEASPETVQACIEEVGIGFLFAPLLHGAMKYAIGPRRELGVRTVFNILGPLTNPADAKAQVLGVYDPKLTSVIAKVLKELGSTRALVVHGSDGMDEITISGETIVAELNDGIIREYKLCPESLGLQQADTASIRVESAEESAALIKTVFAGEKGPARDIVILNAGAALWVSGISASIQEGVDKAGEILDSGAANGVLERLAKRSFA